jgi:gliding motility-associated-like protein
MRGLRWILTCWLAFCWAWNSFGQDPCVSTGNGLPYVSTNPNYVCEALDAFVYINVAQGYANPSDAAPENFNFSWYPFDLLGGTDTQSFEMVFDSTVTIWCVAQDLQNNCIWTDTITVQVETAVEIGLSNDTLVCDLNGFTLQPSAEAQAMSGISWNWEPSLLLLDAQTATPQLLIDADQWYHVTATTPAPGNCTYEDSIFVTANVAQVELGPDQQLCEGETVDLNCGINPNVEDIEWSTGDSIQTITVDTSGVYWVTASNPAGCVRTDTVTIDIFDNPVIALQAGSAACEGQPVELTANVTADTTVAGVGWSTGEGGTTITVTGPGLYEAIAVTVTGCTGSASVSPEFLPSPEPDLAADTTLCLEEEGPIWVDVSQPDVSYQWSSGGDQPGALLSEAGIYTVTLTLLANGCQDSASIELIDFCPQDSVFFPNAFTPDGDLVNDRFGGFAESIGTFQLAVFNRWGVEVFRSEELDAHWNGRLPNGELAPSGMYGYRAVWRPLAEDGVTNLQFREKVGTVTLIR